MGEVRKKPELPQSDSNRPKSGQRNTQQPGKTGSHASPTPDIQDTLKNAKLVFETDEGQTKEDPPTANTDFTYPQWEDLSTYDLTNPYMAKGEDSDLVVPDSGSEKQAGKQISNNVSRYKYTDPEIYVGFPRVGVTPKCLVDHKYSQRNVEHIRELYNIKTRRLEHLEISAARTGYSTDASVLMEIEDIRKDIKQLQDKITDDQLQPDRQNLLDVDKQKELLAVVAAHIGVPINKIKMIDIVIGSVIAIMEMPLPQAANLVALKKQGYQRLAEFGIADVQLDTAATSPQNQVEFEKVVRFEESILSSRKSSEEIKDLLNRHTKYLASKIPIRLRVKLTDEFVEN